MGRIAPALALVALALPASASAQATRTWVSGVGDDVNPCSRTAPCKTFAGAISKTAAGGIIMTMDDGGFGTLTITKPITVDGGRGHSAGVLSSGGINGINVNINPATQPANFVNNGTVVLKNLKLEGNTSIPTTGGFTPGLNGVRITNAKSVKLYNDDIGFYSRSGVAIEPDAGQTTRVVVKNSEIHDNGGAGVMGAPLNGAIARVTVRGNEIDDNGCGIVAAEFGLTNNFTSNCGTNTPNANAGTVAINVLNNGIQDSNSSSVFANGTSTLVRIGGNDITGSLGTALSAINSGSLLTWSDNRVSGNPGGNGATTGTIGFAKRAVRKRAVRHCAKLRARRSGDSAKRHLKACAKRYARHHV
jgi:hypothetical protein